ncbi:MAG: aminotransferase class V-fold PLP-dependent enzyme [Candidatus Zixiibacteriota bacterium]
MTDDLRSKFESARALFPHTKEVVYFNAASYGPFASSVQAAIDENIRIRLNAATDDSHYAFSVADELRSDYAGLIGATKKQVGLGLNTTFGLNIAAFGLQLKKGDEILMSDIEFPAAVYTFKAAAQTRGLKVRLVKSHERRFDIDELVKSIRPKTRVLALSYVQFFNGFKNDLRTISDICKKHHMYFVVDGIQGMGTEPLNVRKLGIDVFASGCQKWMLAPQGCGFFYLSDEVRDSIKAPFMSWLGADWGMKFSDLFYFDKPYFDSARRFEMGYYVVLNLVGMKASVKIFQDLGIPNIQKHTHALIDRLVTYLRTNSHYRITSDLTSKHRSSIFTFTCENVQALHRRILDHKIILVNREGSIRVSSHLYNNEADIGRLIEVLDRFSKTG